MTPVATLKIVFAMVLWALCFPVIVAGLEYSPHLTFAAMRAALAGIILTLLALVLGRPFPRGWRVWMTLSGVGLGATSLGFLGMFHAAEFVSPGLATVIANTQPLLAAVLAALWLGEKLSIRGGSGLFAGFAGMELNIRLTREHPVVPRPGRPRINALGARGGGGGAVGSAKTHRLDCGGVGNSV